MQARNFILIEAHYALVLVLVLSRYPCQKPPSIAIYFRSITIQMSIAAVLREHDSVLLRKILPKQFHNQSISVSCVLDINDMMEVIVSVKIS